jgi:isoprenylcysteine carboxyl methyltransferase (ICMT) family protein YpbQ
MNKWERLFVWLGGALFVASLAVCAWRFLISWSNPSAIQARWPALLADALLFGVFAAHHSLFARQDVKAILASSVPERLLRSVYVWTASVLLLIVCALWQPVGGNVYHVTGWRALAHAGVQLAGVWLIGQSAGTIDPLELAGIRRQSASDALQITGPYRWVRHPLYLGWLMGVFGAAHMTGDRLTFAVTSSIYLFVAIPWEERSLVRTFGKQYEDYKHQVRWRVVPFVY